MAPEVLWTSSESARAPPDKSGQIFNVNETGLSGKETSRQCVATLRGTHIYQQQVTTSDHITANICISADGKVLPTGVIFSKCLPHRNYRKGVPSGWLYRVSDSGYIDGGIFREWFNRIFIPHCGWQQPVQLIMDNNDGHVCLDIMETALENDIELLCLHTPLKSNSLLTWLFWDPYRQSLHPWQT